jgi:hypothetical protein
MSECCGRKKLSRIKLWYHQQVLEETAVAGARI